MVKKSSLKLLIGKLSFKGNNVKRVRQRKIPRNLCHSVGESVNLPSFIASDP